MRLTTFDSLESLQQLQPEWDDLLARSISNRIFSTYEWQVTWWQAYHPGDMWVIAAYEDDGRLIAIAPWFVEVRPDERVVRSIGCVDVTDYVDLIVEPEHLERVCAALALHVAEHRDRFDRINLCNIPESSPTLQVFPARLEECGLKTETVLQEVCPVIVLPEEWEQYLESLDKKQRHELRRKIRKAEGEAESLHWYIVGAEHNLEAELDAFLELMAASQPAKAQFLSDPANVAFIRKMTHAMAERGWLQLSFLVINGERFAAYFNFDYGNTIQVYNSGLRLNASNQLSPGIVLLAYNIQHAIAEKRHLFDFLRGNEEYKYRMGAVDTRVFMLKAQ